MQISEIETHSGKSTSSDAIKTRSSIGSKRKTNPKRTKKRDGAPDSPKKAAAEDSLITLPTLCLTPRRARNSLSSSLNPKYIEFLTPPSRMASGSAVRTRRSRRHNLNSSAEVSSTHNDILLTTAGELFGCLRRTQSTTSIVSAKVSPLGKSYISPIDKMIFKNGSSSPASTVLDNSPCGKLNDSEKLNTKRRTRSYVRNSSRPDATEAAVICVDVEDEIPSSIAKDLKSNTPNEHINVQKSKTKIVKKEVISNENEHLTESKDDANIKSTDVPKEETLIPEDTEITVIIDEEEPESEIQKSNSPVTVDLLSSDEEEDKEEPDVEIIVVTKEINSNITEKSNVSVEPPELTITYDNADNEANVETVGPPVAISPSAVSTDSAKGSSVITDTVWMNFSTGDIFWGQIFQYCYWPCMVCPDPDGKTIDTEGNKRNDEQHVIVHVRFFADNGRRNWIKRENLHPYSGLENYQEQVAEIKKTAGQKLVKFGNKWIKHNLLTPKLSKAATWHEAIKEANIVAITNYSDRLEKFYELYEKSRDAQKLERKRRQSMIISVESASNIGNLHGSTDNVSKKQLLATTKRNRSVSPFSPAYSPVKTTITKKRKLSNEEEADNRLEINEPNDAYDPSNVPTTSTVQSSLTSQDIELFNDSEFKKFYIIIKEFVMGHNQDDKLERSLIVAARNVWALKQINQTQIKRNLIESYNKQEMGSSIVGNIRGEGTVRRLSNRLKTITVRRSLTLPMSSEAKTVANQIREIRVDDKPKKLVNRPIEEVIEDIFKLDRKYLFKGYGRDPVCKYCFRPGGKLVRCSKGCQTWLHSDCIGKDFNYTNRRAARRSNVFNNLVNENTNMGDDPLSLNNNEIDFNRQSTSLNALPPVEEHHVTAESETISVVCQECALNLPPRCGVCNSKEPAPEEQLLACHMPHCTRTFHASCCTYWPQSKFTMSKNVIESFRCPSHVCHTCVSDDPKRKFQHLSSAKLTKCVKCPATYHTDSTCIPAGSQILTMSHIICPRHRNLKVDQNVNVSWCFICVSGGQVVCCETCPTAVHATCVNFHIDTKEGYICEECESGRMPLYGEMVWAKFNSFRWWPAIILPPNEVPDNIMRKPHNYLDFVVRFFGTHDHGWISRRRVYLYVEGDSSEPPKSKSQLDLNYNRGVMEAKKIYEIIKSKKEAQRLSNEGKEKLHPQPYVRIKCNRPVHPVKLTIDLDTVNKCDCSPDSEHPCGPDTNCLNRVLYHECNPKLCPAGKRCENQMLESKVSPRLEVVYMKERGFGLVCREAISAGTFVIEYVGEVINDDEFKQRMAQKSNDREENFYFLSVEKDNIIDAGPKGNMARFMNHSCEPNCETQKWSVNGLNRVGLFAIKDIPENTELTFNYHWDDLLGNAKKTCLCGAAKCVGEIGGKYKEDKVKENVEVASKTKTKGKAANSKNTKPLKRLQHKSDAVTKSKTHFKIKIKPLAVAKKPSPIDDDNISTIDLTENE